LTGKQKELQIQEALQDISSSSCAPFEILKVEGCGSDAKMYAVNGVPKMCPQQCAVACGSYLSGNHGQLQTRSPSAFYQEEALRMILSPNECTHEAKETTLPFPYFIPGCGNCLSGCTG
jgi:hypothetical protein